MGLAVILACSPWWVHAQNEEDALRISNVFPGGTARSAGMANAFGALGADPSSVGINPAGMALYRRSELSLTPGFEVNSATNTHYGSRATDAHTRAFFNNLALVVNNPNTRGNGRHRTTYGIVYDRTASYHWRTLTQGTNVPSTILQGFANEANGTPDAQLFNAFPFTSGLAWDTYGIDPALVIGTNGDTIPDQYMSAVPFGTPMDQQRTVETRGAANSTSFFYSGSMEDKLYWGVSLGIVGHRYRRTFIHTEQTLDGSIDLERSSYQEDLNTSGTGLDIKVGLIGRISDRVRAGVTYHSPQWMQLNDTYVTFMNTSFRTPDANGRTNYTATSPDGLFSYNLNTPWRIGVNAAFIAGPFGLISADYTFTDFTKARFRASDLVLDAYDFAQENSNIATVFRATHSVRLGSEWRNGNWYYRLGWALAPDAYIASDPRRGLAHKTYAGGLGYRTEHLSIDLGLNYVRSTSFQFLYDPALIEPTREDRDTFRALLTISFRG